MKITLKSLYRNTVLSYPLISLMLSFMIIAGLGYFAKDFKLDASADSLVLENDQDLEYYRAISAKYGSDDYLVITYEPKNNLIAEDTINHIKNLKQELLEIKRVESITSILDVPLINSPRIGLKEIQENTPTLLSESTDKNLAFREFTESPLYKNLIASPDGKTTAIQVIFKRDSKYHELLNERNELRAKRLTTKLSTQEKFKLVKATQEFAAYSAELQDVVQVDIASVRKILTRYQKHATIHLGGVPMIVSDMIDYIGHDIEVFGIGVLCFIILLLSISFRKARWVLIPMIICFAAGLGMLGFLGLVDWRVTVVSSNFISLLLIITLSLSVHLIVRYREIHRQNPDITSREIVWLTVESKFEPALFTAVTTMVAFGSLLVSGIRPVIDFGWMMFFGVVLAFVLTFIIFPASAILLKPGAAPKSSADFTAAITRYFAQLIEAKKKFVYSAYIVISLLCVYGLSLLTVENRFIDYFKSSTEIYQGMITIDQKLGGTTPLDVVIDPDKGFYEFLKEFEADELEEDEDLGDAGISGTSYWFNTFSLETVKEIHDYLESLPETGKVLSMSTTMEMLKLLNNDEPLENIHLSVMHKRLPSDIKKALFDPYMSSDGNQIRFSIRVYESDSELQRQDLLEKIKTDLTEKFDLKKEQIHLTGMVVLYNNMLQSLFKSQIMTLGVVFLAILMMFMLLFQSVKISLIAIVPNIVAALFVLGLMGWLNIRLDIMTITIAAITIGIAVDDTIHYVHRFLEEYPKDLNAWAAVNRCHNSIGRAMYYTTITITLGFSILALSNFIPTIYFGLLTGFAMVVALLADLTLLPLLLVAFKPVKKTGLMG